jgi:hypothetical protein
MRTAVAAEEPDPSGGGCALSKARISDEEAAAAGKRALVEAVLRFRCGSKQAADAAERVLGRKPPL